ncbi:MAG: type I glyceraldehyde-3-phosphate dehydrogenase [bacterium]|nr:type I glyceraldehyde-3-phosphate dehydrogenase [bacterium]MDZ4296050.1 type I glyceraldehyde-3-phosphate dehydrogenase [Patescibacteria group bacterium]
MKRTRIAINGFGRIGRTFFRQAFGRPDAEIVAINDIASPENLAYLLQYDTVYGRYEKAVAVREHALVVDDREIALIQEKDPGKLPWKDLAIDVVVESTGIFESHEKAAAHLKAGAKRVVISAPAKDDLTPTATPGVNEAALKDASVTSNASCTTNATTPVLAVLVKEPGIRKAIASTVHGYTATQGLVDGPDRKGDFRRGRAAAMNIVPSSTGAASAATKAVPELHGKFDGIAIRVPVIAGSLLDITFLASRPTSPKEINDIFRKAAAQKEWRGILAVTEEPLVSSDVLKNPHGSIVDLTMTRVVDGDLVKVLSWYDNEWGYGAMLLKHVLAAARLT